MDPVTFSLRLPADLAEKLDAMAESQKRSRSNVIRYLLTKALAEDATRKRDLGKGAPRVRMS